MKSTILRIRACRADDLAALRRICEETSTIPTETEAQRAFLHLVFCDPYVETQTEHCFVAVNELDEPLGYILCAPDTPAFLREYRRTYLPQIDRLGVRYAIMGRGAQFLHFALGRRYSAHLHIDLSEQARHKATGSGLMQALQAHLRSIGVSTLFLSCDRSNENAVRFYLRNGFRCVLTAFGVKIFISHF